MTEVDVDAQPIPEDPAPATPDEERHGGVRNVVEWVAIIVGALAVALIVKTFLIQAFFIPSLSMYPTLDEGDRVLVNKLSYKLHDVHRGDLVVFERPKGQPESEIKDLIKRVIGLPGETIEAREGTVYIDGKALEESYLVDGITTDNLPRQVIAKGHVFVMGDNRSDSADSRVFGAIDEDSIVGRAFVRVWPIPELSLL
ncbi:MAG TPA: signal peptidase I [Acidimicrobiales bacterium]|nr:signal peptidase I [Acidimicrobiales bacterium]